MDEPVNFDFSGKSNEEVLSLFFHEIRGHVSSIKGYLTMLNLEGLPEKDARNFREVALKKAEYVQEVTLRVFECLDEQGKDQ